MEWSVLCRGCTNGSRGNPNLASVKVFAWIKHRCSPFDGVNDSVNMLFIFLEADKIIFLRHGFVACTLIKTGISIGLGF